MPMIAIDALEAHPMNANKMPASALTKLMNHIRETGQYPAIIVRAHPHKGDSFEILDGHHRVQALRELGYEEAHCDIWEVEDEEHALTLLLTLNRLRGEDDPSLRGLMLSKLRDMVGMEDLRLRVPDDVDAIRAQIELANIPPAPIAAADISILPEAVTFFLTPMQKKRLLQHLKEIARDRSEALVRLLALNEG